MTGTRIVAGVLLALAAGAAGGCGGGRAGVSGRVMVDGRPLPAGDVAFIPVDPALGPTAGAVVENGEFRVPAEKGLAPGDYRVEVRAFRETGKKTWDGMGDENAPAAQKRFVAGMEMYIPARYNTATELKAAVTPGGPNQFTFDLSTAAKK